MDIFLLLKQENVKLALKTALNVPVIMNVVFAKRDFISIKLTKHVMKHVLKGLLVIMKMVSVFPA
jgi:hypothetical protein